MERRQIVVLVFGASNVLYSEEGPEASLFALIEEELRRRAPETEWRLVPGEVPPARNMAVRVTELVEAHGVNAAYYMPSSTYFAYDFVIARVHRRFPWAEDMVSRLGSGLKGAAGGQFEGADGLRGLVFRLPQRLAAAVIGAEPYVRTDHAIANTVATMRRLSEIEGFLLVAREPFTRIKTSPKKLEKYLGRISQFTAALREVCSAAGFKTYSLPEYMAGFGLEPVFYPGDNIHMTLDTRRYEAKAAAEYLVAGVEERSSTV